MQVEGHDIDIVVQGFPGKSVCHGGLGWSTVVLLRGHSRVALIDAGSFGMRKPMTQENGRTQYLGQREVAITATTWSRRRCSS